MAKQTYDDEKAQFAQGSQRTDEQAGRYVRKAAAGAVLGSLSRLIPIMAGGSGHMSLPRRRLSAPVGWVASREKAGPRQRAALVAAAGVAASWGQLFGALLDRRVEGWLRSRGMARPRLVLAAGSAVVGAVASGWPSAERSVDD